MPTVGWVEDTIYRLEEVKVDFILAGKNVRSDAPLPHNYSAQQKTRNSSNVSHFKQRLQSQFPGYDFKVYDGNGDTARGNMLMGTLRDTYPDRE